MIDKITSKTSFDGIKSVIAKMQEIYPNEPLMIISESYLKNMKNTFCMELVEELEKISRSSFEVGSEANDIERKNHLLGKSIGLDMAVEVIKEKIGWE